MLIPLSVLALVGLFTTWWVYFYKNVGGDSPYRQRLDDYHGGHRRPG